MNNVIAIPVQLTFVPMLYPIPLAVQVVLVTAPGNAGHQVNHKARFAILCHPLGHVLANAVDHDKVVCKIDGFPIIRTGLIAGQLL